VQLWLLQTQQKPIEKDDIMKRTVGIILKGIADYLVHLGLRLYPLGSQLDP